jgi:hypothetical protein
LGYSGLGDRNATGLSDNASDANGRANGRRRSKVMERRASLRRFSLKPVVDARL